MIHNVKKLSSKLGIEAIGDPLDVVVLEQGKIEVHQSGSDKSIPPQVSAKCNGTRDAEALRLDVAEGITGIHRGTATWTGNQVRNVDVWVCAFHSERVSSKTRSEGHTRASFEHSTDLPSPEHPCSDSGRPFRRADLQCVVNLQVLRNIEVREATIQFGIEP